MEALLATMELIREEVNCMHAKINAKLDPKSPPQKKEIKCNLKFEAANSCISALEMTSKEPTKSRICELRVTRISANMKTRIEREEKTKCIVNTATIEMKANDYRLTNGRVAGKNIEFANVNDQTNLFSALNGYINVKLEKSFFLQHTLVTVHTKKFGLYGSRFIQFT